MESPKVKTMVIILGAGHFGEKDAPKLSEWVYADRE